MPTILHSGHLTGALVVCALLSACGDGGTTRPKTDNTVASVAIAAPGSPLAEGETVQLTATARNADGTTLTGKTITWSSSAVTIATVSDQGVVTGMKNGSVTITATSEGRSGTLDLVVNKGVPLVLDASRAVSSSIGPAGGTITATGTNGIVYTLTVPANSLRRSQQITMTPVKTIRTLSMSGAVLGAVDLQPSGLTFTRPVRLKIAASTASTSGLHLVGFTFEQQGDSLQPAVVADSGSSATVLMNHFSGGGAVFGSTTDIRVLMSTIHVGVVPPSRPFVDSLMLLSLLSPPDFDAELQVLRNWFNQLIIPEIQRAQNDSALVAAIADYDLAVTMPIAFGITGGSALGPEKAAAAAAIAPKLRQAIQDENSVCAQQRSITAAANALFWQTQAADFGVDTSVEQLDRATVLINLCIRVAFTRSDYPDPAVANTQGTLDVRAGMQFGTDPNLALELFTWTVDVTGSTSDGTSTGNSDTSGGFTLLVTPTGQVTLQMKVKMCIFDNQLPYLDVCGVRTISRPFGTTLTGNQIILTQAGLEQIRNASKIVGSLTISPSSATAITSTDLHELSQLSEVTGDVSIVNFPGLNRLDGLHALSHIGGTLQLNNLSGLTDMSGLALTQLGGLNVNFTNALTAIQGVQAVTSLDLTGLHVTNNASLSSIGGFFSLRSAKELVLQNTPLLTSLQSMRGVSFASEVLIQNMPGLTTLDDLTGLGTSAPLTLLILDNPNLGDFSALSAVKHAHKISLNSTLLTSLSDLAALETIDRDGDITVDGAAFTSIALPSLTLTGSISANLDDMPHLTTVSLPALLEGSVFVSGSSCASGQAISVQLPALKSAANFDIGAGSAPQDCSITVNAPSLTTVTLNAVFTGGVNSVTLGASLTAQGLQLSSTSLTGITLPTLHLQRLILDGNPNLSSIGGGGGGVQTSISIIGNPNLSTQVATVFANSFNPHGTITISGNKVP